MADLEILRLSKMSIDMKIKLAAKAGYKVKVINTNGRCYIDGADKYCDNDFKSIDEVLNMIKPDLKRKHYDFVA